MTRGTISAGDQLPDDIELVNQRGERVRLVDHASQTLILFFFLRTHTPGCTTQACELRDNWPLLRDRGVAVFGVSPQEPEAQESFVARHDLPFDLLSDPGRTLARRFGFADDSLLGKLKGGIVRSTAIVDPGGTVRAVLRDVKPTAHFDLLRVQLG